ncbi:hypothetical protein ACRDNQ_07270 [Palleronia sp. KMU-117]|uniref:hypothetical protein n=1 Tax=Palleronia sp. KMU-117 TaxID=3434108 RepID=UPI003D74BF88
MRFKGQAFLLRALAVSLTNASPIKARWRDAALKTNAGAERNAGGAPVGCIRTQRAKGDFTFFHRLTLASYQSDQALIAETVFPA